MTPGPGNSRARGQEPCVSFVVPVRNGAATLGPCLRSIADNDYPRRLIQIIVVDNGSSDQSRAIAASTADVVLECPGRRASELRNLGVKAAHGAVIAFVDSDHVIDWQWARAAADALRQPRVAAAGAPYHAPTPATWVQRHYDALRGHVTGNRDVEWLAAGNLAIWRTAFEAVGGFDSSLETCEDVDFCARLRRRGYRVVADERLYSAHFGDPRTLTELFKGELWRGRDNARVTFRRPISFRSLVSLLVPVVDLMLMIAAVAGLMLLGVAAGVAAAGAAAAGVMSLAGLRAFSKIGPSRLTAGAAGQAVIVAAVHDLGRMCALVARAGHDTRRRAGDRP